MLAVSNSTPLIFLARIGKIHLLEKVFDNILIPEEVYQEVVVRGGEKGYPDSALVGELTQKFIIVKRVKVDILKDAPIHEGEKAVLALAVEEGIEDVLIDEAKVRRMARMMNLKPKGTIWVLSKFYEEELISKEEFKESIQDLIRIGYRIREEILFKFLKELAQ